MIREITSEKFKKDMDAEISRCIENYETLKVCRKNKEAFIVIGEKD